VKKLVGLVLLPSMALAQGTGTTYVPPTAESKAKLGVNEPDKAGGLLGTRLNLHA